ncbi:MAG: aldo/keto reductase, partial [Kiritimatiellae bacterium]|nr:aldo/keto reductase [Kiritimatiellia bacterium]
PNPDAMNMTRREFLKSAALLAALAPFARLRAQDPATPPADGAAAAKPRPAGPLSRRTMAGESVSLLGFGCMRLPRGENGKIDRPAARRLWSRYLEAGGNYFDTAYMYHDGESEVALGEFLSERPRSSYFLVDKMPVWMARTEDGVKRVFEDQLARTKAEYFDFYLMHSLGWGNWDLAKKIRALDFLLEKKKEGRIRHLGFSFHDQPEAMDPILEAYDWEFAMIQLNYQDWTRYRSKEQYEKLVAKGVDVAVMEPLRGGALARLNDPAKAILRQADPDASPASWAFRWVASLPAVKLVNSGMGRESDLEDNIRTFSPVKELSDDERGTIAAALAAFQRTQAVPCTACRYCTPCPVGVAIPDVFALWNAYKAEGNKRRFVSGLERLTESARPSRCVRCMQCTKHCPQQIAIPDELAKVAAEYAALKAEA